MQTINDLEVAMQAGFEAMRHLKLDERASAAIEVLLPDGLTPVIELTHENGRRKRGSAASWNFNPHSDRIVISFRNSQTPPDVEHPTNPAVLNDGTPPHVNVANEVVTSVTGAMAGSDDSHDAVSAQEVIECCQALNSAENSNRQFIALKWFRDDFLATVDYPWVKLSQRRQRVLSHAIELGKINARKIPNPKAPQYPTTTISLNRAIPTPGVTPRFQPVPIRGESASTTLLRDRGSF